MNTHRWEQNLGHNRYIKISVGCFRNSCVKCIDLKSNKHAGEIGYQQLYIYVYVCSAVQTDHKVDKLLYTHTYTLLFRYIT